MIAVLYVDDEPELLEIGKLFLEQNPEFSVDTLTSATQALDVLRERHYDAILSDYQMPVMDGIRFLKEVRARGDNIPFIIFTGRGREEVILEALNSGVDFYLQKGGDPETQFAELTHIVSRAVREKGADRAFRESEAKYRTILENIQDVFYRTDTAGNLILASPSIASLLGYATAQELYGLNIAATLYFNPEQRAQFLAALEKTGSVRDYEVILKKKDGTPIYVSTSSHKYYDPAGTVLGVEGIFRDITEKKHAEDQLRQAYEQIAASEEELKAQFEELKFGQDALRESERKLQGIVNGSPIPQFVIDRNHTVISWNAALERYSGIRADEVIGTHGQWRAFYPHERPCMADLLVDGGIGSIPTWYQGKFSKSRYIEGAYEATDFFAHMGEKGTWLYFTASVLRDARGEITGAVETLEDITDWKQAEGEILKMSRFQQSIISNANVWIMVLDHHGTVLLWNEAAAEISGYPAAEVLNRNQIWKCLYPDPEYRKTITSTLLSIIREQNYLQNFETVIQTRSGERKTLFWNTRNLDDPKSTNPTFVAIGIDISRAVLEEQAHRDSESQLSAIVRGSPIPQFVIDRNHRVIQWNTALEHYSGISADTVIGTNQHWRAFYPHERPCLADLLVDGSIEQIPEWYAGKYTQSALLGDGYEATDFFAHMGPSGTWLHFTAVPIRDKNGAIIGAVETLDDITEEKRAGDAVLKANRKLNLMSSITRHDIRNQLTALMGYLTLLQASLTDPRDTGYLSRAEASAQNIEHQLEFTREYQEIGVKSPAWQETGAIIRDAASQLSLGSVRVEIEPALPEVYADPLLVKVFYNLIDNACRYGETITRIRFFGAKTPDGLVLTCEDDGVGIPPDQKDRLFERGFGRHTGFGLFLAREILSITGLTIRETGSAGTGARFEILVPHGAYRALHGDPGKKL